MYIYNIQSIQYHAQERLMKGMGLNDVKKELKQYFYNAPRHVIETIVNGTEEVVTKVKESNE